MPEAERVLAGVVAPPPSAPALPGSAVFSHSRLLRAFEAIMEPALVIHLKQK
jgi:putative colanic acid biosynthesis UDP-glucose lipid carrier transferase